MSNLNNNLFRYATKELSQDAFICWLCSYALEDADNSDAELIRCGHMLVSEFLKKDNVEIDDINDVILKDVQKQFGQIDILLTAEYSGEVFKIIIEDKINSSEHDDQLNKYKSKFKNENVHLICIYLKTGFQSDLSEVNKAGYKLFDRKDFLSVLKSCNSQNSILLSFLAFWEEFESIAQSYKEKPVTEWPDWQAVNGFYDEMKSFLEEFGYWAGYDYVPNPSGGFWGFWYGDYSCETIEIGGFKATIYLQVETSWNYETNNYDIRICLKISDSNKSKDEKLRLLRDIIVGIQSDYGFEKPSKLGYGQHVTTGIYKASIFDSNDFKETIIESLEKYKLLVGKVNEKLKQDVSL